MATNIHFALVRIETDRDIEEITKAIEKVENAISILTRLDVQQLQKCTPEDEEDMGGPVLYWP